MPDSKYALLKLADSMEKLASAVEADSKSFETRPRKTTESQPDYGSLGPATNAIFDPLTSFLLGT